MSQRRVDVEARAAATPDFVVSRDTTATDMTVPPLVGAQRAVGGPWASSSARRGGVSGHGGLPRAKISPVSKPFEHPVVVRWRDSDALAHVNHAVFLTYLEEGRDAFLTTVMGPNPMYVMARLEIDFERELRIERRQVVVTVSVERVGRTSIVLNEAILDAEGATAASARTTIVAWEPGERRPLPINDDLRARLLG